MREFRFTSRPDEIDQVTVHEWLCHESYWAQGRTAERHASAVSGSRNFAMIDRTTGATVAYARVITDGATFAWLCDVFVTDAVRGLGVGKSLIAGILDELEPIGLKRIALVTADAHGLYEQYGFTSLEKPEMWMARLAG